MITKNKFTLTKEERKTLIYNGIQFRSPLEIFTYKLLTVERILFTYEEINYDLMPGFTYSAELWEKNAQGVFGKVRSNKIRAITHTPDFHIKNKDNVVIAIIETKGQVMADFKLRRKMLLQLLELNGKSVPYYMPSNLKGVEECIKMIKNYE